MRMIAIITARGGSKRIPRKNIKEFMGKPMLGYAVEAAQQAGIFDKVMVSTDDQEIAAIAESLGAEVPFLRSERTSNDYATTYDVIEEVLHEYQKRGENFDEVCCIYPCVPFLKAQSLVAAHEKMVDGVNSVDTVCAYPVPVEWAYTIDADGYLHSRDPQALLIRSQDLTPCYYDVGMFYFARTELVLKQHTLLPGPLRPFIIDERECQDIDTMADWRTAEAKYRLLQMEEE